MTRQEEIREGIVNLRYCTGWCGEIAFTCTKQSICPAFNEQTKTAQNRAKRLWAEKEADQILQHLNLQDVVIKVDIPEGWLLVKPTKKEYNSSLGLTSVWVQVGKPKIVAVEPLIEEVTNGEELS